MYRCFIVLLLFVFSVFAQTDSLNVAWDQNPESDMFEYRLYRGVNTTVLDSLQTIAYPDTSTVDRDAIGPGNLYCFSLLAIDSAGNNSNFSDTVCVGIPLITETAVPANVNSQVVIPLNSVFSDLDNSQIELTRTFSVETNCTVSVVSTDLVIDPAPDFLGAGSFYVRLEDPDLFWDGKTIAFSIDSRDLTPPIAPTNVTVTR